MLQGETFPERKKSMFTYTQYKESEWTNTSSIAALIKLRQGRKAFSVL